MVLLRKPQYICFAGIFRNSNASFLGAFALHMGISNALEAEITVAMIAIETSYQKDWHPLCLQTDSLLLTLAFKTLKIIPWHLLNRWENCKLLCASMTFIVTHIFR